MVLVDAYNNFSILRDYGPEAIFFSYMFKINSDLVNRKYGILFDWY